MSDELIEFTCTERLVLANFTPDWLRRGIIMPDPDLRRPDGLHLTRYHEEHSDEDDTGLSIELQRIAALRGDSEVKHG